LKIPFPGNGDFGSKRRGSQRGNGIQGYLPGWLA
jgi:hypothetical protein